MCIHVWCEAPGATAFFLIVTDIHVAILARGHLLRTFVIRILCVAMPKSEELRLVEFGLEALAAHRAALVKVGVTRIRANEAARAINECLDEKIDLSDYEAQKRLQHKAKHMAAVRARAKQRSKSAKKAKSSVAMKVKTKKKIKS